MFRPSLGLIGYYYPVPMDFPWPEGDPRWPIELALVEAIEADRQKQPPLTYLSTIAGRN